MEYHGKSLRHELKYIINYTEYHSLKTRLSTIIPKDLNSGENGYHIRSLYFDDVYHTALSEKASGVQLRQKYRVRIYDKSDSVIKLERKEKFGDLISKQSLTLKKDEFYSLIKNEEISFLLKSSKDMPKEIYWAIRTKMLAPAVIVDYQREVYVLDEGNVRITFDQNLQAGINTSDIFSPDIINVNVFTPGTMVLEVKYDDFLPDYVRQLLQLPAHSREAVSKYVYCRLAQFKYNPASQYFFPAK